MDFLSFRYNIFDSMIKLKNLLFLCLLVSGIYSVLHAQNTSDSAHKADGILLVPYQSMMYFSDADRDIAEFSNTNEREVRSTIANKLEIAIYHQLLAHFDAISLVRATSLNGEEDLRRIYAATRYSLYSGNNNPTKPVESEAVKSVSKNLNSKSKENKFHTSDSLVMFANIESSELFPYLYKKHHAKYLLFITQFELNTSNKNSIEWTTRKYQRSYTLHYNLFDHTGKLLRAETITIDGDNENKLNDINTKYLTLLAQKLVAMVVAINN